MVKAKGVSVWSSVGREKENKDIRASVKVRVYQKIILKYCTS